MRFLRRQRWKYDHKLFWWQQTPPAEFPTWIVEGAKGAGKSRYMSRQAVWDMRKGVTVVSNFTIRDRFTGQSSFKIASWIDVLRWSVWALENQRPVKFYIDEIHLWMDSRSFKTTPAWFRGFLAQSRHYGVGICGSVQNLRRLEIVARELVDELLYMDNLGFRLMGLWGPHVPLFRVSEVDRDSVGDGDTGDVAAYRFKHSSFCFPRWYAGYDTQELMSVEEWRPDEAELAEVAELLERARVLVEPGLIAAWADEDDSGVSVVDDEYFEAPAGVSGARFTVSGSTSCLGGGNRS